VHYFSYHWQRPLSWYRSHFALTRTVEAANGLCLEASPSYILSAETLERMRRVLPQAKLIVILRDPVRRAFSLYQNQKRSHSESRSFDDIVRESIANAPPIVRRDRPLPSIPGSMEPCIWDGYYASQLTALLSIYPREQVLILDSADLFDDTNAVCQRVFDFLGLESCDVQPDKIYNRGYYRETIDPATAEVLREHYRPHDEWLVELTGRRFRWMDEAAGKQEQRAA
jgi:Sulfotransferase domain